MSDFRRNKSSDLESMNFVEGDFGVTLQPPDTNSKSEDVLHHNLLRRGRTPRNAVKKSALNTTSANDFVVNDASSVMSDAISAKLNDGSSSKTKPHTKKSTTVHDAVDNVPSKRFNACDSDCTMEKSHSPMTIENDFKESKCHKNDRESDECGCLCNKTTEKKERKKCQERYDVTENKCTCLSFISKIMSFFGFFTENKKSHCNDSKIMKEKCGHHNKNRVSGDRKGNKVNQNFKAKKEES